MNLLAFFYPGFDPAYLLFVAPGMLLAIWAQIKVKTAYASAGEIPAQSGLSGAETAERILRDNGIHDVAIEEVKSFLGDHYDAMHKVLRLSPDVYHGRSLAALGIAAHESGHALQHAQAYGPLVLRNTMVPVAQFGSSFAWILIMLGFAIQALQVAAIGVALFGAVVLFQLVTLPVELDASRRARAVLLNSGMISSMEDRTVAKVLNAAALTYIAAAVTALLQLLYFVMMISGRRSN